MSSNPSERFSLVAPPLPHFLLTLVSVPGRVKPKVTKILGMNVSGYGQTDEAMFDRLGREALLI